MTASPPTKNVLAILHRLNKVGQNFLENEPGSREQLLSPAYSLGSNLELPSESIQRIGWAEVWRDMSFSLL